MLNFCPCNYEVHARLYFGRDCTFQQFCPLHLYKERKIKRRKIKEVLIRLGQQVIMYANVGGNFCSLNIKSLVWSILLKSLSAL